MTRVIKIAATCSTRSCHSCPCASSATSGFIQILFTELSTCDLRTMFLTLSRTFVIKQWREHLLLHLVQTCWLSPPGTERPRSSFKLGPIVLRCLLAPHSLLFDAAVVPSPPSDLAFRKLLNGPFITPLCQRECLVHS